MVEFTKLSTSWKIASEMMTGNVIVSEIGALMYVILSMAEGHVPCGELVGVT